MMRAEAFLSGMAGRRAGPAEKSGMIEKNAGKKEKAAAVYDNTGCSVSCTPGAKEAAMEEIQRKDYINHLEACLPGREIVIADVEGREGIKDYALSNRGGFQVVISRAALERMMEDPDFEKKCMDALREARKEQAHKIAGLPARGKKLLGCGLVLDGEGEVSRWVLSGNAVQRPTEKKKNSFYWHTEKEDGSYSRFKTEKGTLTIEKKKLSYVPAKDLVKIARAANRQLLKKTISGIQAQIYQLKSGGGDRRVRNVLVKQAQQVLQKARIKDKLLKKEELLTMQQKRAAEKAEFEKSLQLKILLKRKRESRKVREYGQIRDYYETPEERRLEKQLERWEASCGGDPVSPVGQPGVQLPSESGIQETAGSSAAEVTLDISF